MKFLIQLILIFASLQRPILLFGARGLAFLFSFLPIPTMERNLNVISHKRKELGMKPLQYRKVKRENLYYTLKNLVDFLKFIVRREDGFENLIQLDENVQKAIRQEYEKGHGLVGVCYHLGNWELGGRVLTESLGLKLSSLVFRQIHPELEKLIAGSRTGVGVNLLHQRTGLKQAVKRLNEGEMITVLCDQDGTRAGHFTEFMGLVVSFPRVFELFAKKTKASYLPMTLIHEGDDYRALVYEPMTLENIKENPEETYANLARFLEARILENPSQWLLLYDRFKFRHDSFLKEQGLYEERRREYEDKWKKPI